MKTILTSCALATLGLTLGAQAPVAPPAHGPMGPRAGFHRGEGLPAHGDMERMAAFLKLTDDQKTKIKALHEKAEPDIKAKGEKAQEAGKAYREALAGKTEVARLKALHTAAADARFEAQMARRQLREDVKALLTPEQRERAAFLMGARMARRGQGMGQGKGMGKGKGMGMGMGEGCEGPGMGRGPMGHGRPGGAPAPKGE